MNAAQYNITIIIKLDTNNDDEVKGINSERCVGSEDPLKGSSESCQASQSESSSKISEKSLYQNTSDEFQESSEGSDTINQEIDREKGGETLLGSSLRSLVHLPSVSDHDHDKKEKEDEIIIKNIFRRGRTDTWACKKCKFTGDKWFMRKHPCKGLLRKQNVS